jgi:hypothetical protein
MIPSHPKSSGQGSLILLSCLVGWAQLGADQPPSQPAQNSSRTQTRTMPRLTIPLGTILPVTLRTTISASNAKSGQTVRGQIAQEVPLPGGLKIHKGSRIEGQILEVTPGTSADGQNISIRFDKLYSDGEVIPITTSLRAIAGFMEVLAAGTPTQSVGESDVFYWMTTRQIGGDSVYGLGGVVTSAQSGQVVGSSPMSGGVLGQVNANPSGNCRGSLDDNQNPQALWVFSSDACGAYGLSNIHILHAGRTEPVGTFKLQLKDRKTKIQNGDGLLLRVVA